MKKLMLAAALCFVATPVLACPKTDHADKAAGDKTADKDKAPVKSQTPAKKQAPAKQKTDTTKTDGTKVSIK